MRTVEKRLDQLEQSHESKQPVFVWEGTPVPKNLDGRLVVEIRWARTEEEAIPDPSLVRKRGEQRP